MISRLTSFAALFSVLATASMALAADFGIDARTAHSRTAPTPVVQLERVVVTAQRRVDESR